MSAVIESPWKTPADRGQERTEKRDAVLRTAARGVLARLMDGVDPRLVKTVERVLAAEPGVLAVRGVRMRWIGHRLHAEADVDVAPESTLTGAHDLAYRAQHRLARQLPRATTVVHARPALR